MFDIMVTLRLHKSRTGTNKCESFVALSAIKRIKNNPLHISDIIAEIVELAPYFSIINL